MMRTIGRAAILLCVAVLSACTSPDDPSAEAAPPAPARGDRLFADPFDDDRNGWALPDTEAISFDTQDGDFVWEARKRAGLRPHLIAAPLGEAFDRGELRMRDVVVRSHVTPARSAAAVGLFCREVHDTDSDYQWYEFVVRDGYAAIRRADSAGHLDILAVTRKAELPLGDRASLQATCVNDSQGRARLWWSVNGAVLLFVRDRQALGSGAPGLQAYDPPGGTANDRLLVRWHDFTVFRPAR